MISGGFKHASLSPNLHLALFFSLFFFEQGTESVQLRNLFNKNFIRNQQNTFYTDVLRHQCRQNSLPYYQIHFGCVMVHLFAFLILSAEQMNGRFNQKIRSVIQFMTLVISVCYHVLIISIFTQYRYYPNAVGSCQKYYMWRN